MGRGVTGIERTSVGEGGRETRGCGCGGEGVYRLGEEGGEGGKLVALNQVGHDIFVRSAALGQQSRSAPGRMGGQWGRDDLIRFR